jgi:hypothetical protein
MGVNVAINIFQTNKCRSTTCGCFPPSDEFIPYFEFYLRESTLSGNISQFAADSLKRLAKTTENGKT